MRHGQRLITPGSSEQVPAGDTLHRQPLGRKKVLTVLMHHLNRVGAKPSLARSGLRAPIGAAPLNLLNTLLAAS